MEKENATTSIIIEEDDEGFVEIEDDEDDLKSILITEDEDSTVKRISNENALPESNDQFFANFKVIKEKIEVITKELKVRFLGCIIYLLFNYP